MMIDQGAATVPVISKDDGGTPVKKEDDVVEEPDLRLIEEAQKFPTTAGDSIIGMRMTVVQKAWPRNLRSISQRA